MASNETHLGQESTALKAYLVTNRGANRGARLELHADQPNTIGRDLECTVILSDPKCSRSHAKIWYDEDAWWIADQGSSNGTYVNDQVIDTAQLLDGTEIRIGSETFSFQTTFADDAKQVAEADTATRRTVVRDESFNTAELGQFSLDQFKKIEAGEDLYGLFQLSVELLGEDDPGEVAKISLRQLYEQTKASVAGLMWLTEAGELSPKLVLPEDQAEVIRLDPQLTQRVVKQKRAIRLEHDTKNPQHPYADSICVPLISGETVLGAIHLYRSDRRFSDAHFKLACSIANIVVRTLSRANRHASLQAEHQRLSQKSGEASELLGESEPIRQLKSKIARIARASGCVLIRGESGVGKELVARALHLQGPRAARPMLSINCAAIPRDLMESQLFGHKKGAFTSADSDHSGLFQRADLGTLFLDEIGEMTLEGQAKLLRILEGHPFLPVGGTQEITVDVRVICATNRDLREFVAAKQFREDLFYRLSVFELVIPPLRDRGGDIRLLIEHFMRHFCRQHGRPNLRLSPAALQRLLGFHWPGNVRQMRNVIDSAVVMAEGDEILVEDLGLAGDVRASQELETLAIDHWEKRLIQLALERTGGNIPEAAQLLNISRATLYRKLEEPH